MIIKRCDPLSLHLSFSPQAATNQHQGSVLLKDTSAGWIQRGQTTKKREREKEKKICPCSNQHVNRGGLRSRFLWGVSTQQASQSNSPLWSFRWSCPHTAHHGYMCCIEERQVEVWRPAVLWCTHPWKLNANVLQYGTMSMTFLLCPLCFIVLL